MAFLEDEAILSFPRYEIPLPVGRRYYITENCDILDLKQPAPSCVIYRWDASTAFDPIPIVDENGNVHELSPVIMYMKTFYEFLPLPILDISTKGLPRSRYRYDTRKVKRVDDNTFDANGVVLKRFGETEMYVSSTGSVFNALSYRVHRHTIDKKGYHITTLYMNGRFRIHRLVYQVWVGAIPVDHDIHHEDGLTWHNDYLNLAPLESDIHHRMPNGNYVYDDEMIEEVCALMAAGIRPAEAARMCGVPAERAVKWRAGSRPTISEKYEYPELGQWRNAKLTEEQVEEVCKLLEENRLNNTEIGKLFGVNRYTIQDIRKGISWRHISAKYNIIKDEPGVKHLTNDTSRRNATINPDIVEEIWRLFQEGMTPKQVQIKLAPKYGGLLSYTIIAKIRRRERWSSLTDKLGPIPGDPDFDTGSQTIESVS